MGEEKIAHSADARHIGVIFDKTMSMEQHINMICKTAWLMLRHIGLIRKFLNNASPERLSHAFITSKLDYQHGPLSDLPVISTSVIQSDAVNVVILNKLG